MHSQNVVIVGAGIVGLATAYALLQRGIKQVTVLEQAVVDHKRCASHGRSRLLRFEYGPDRLYSQMVAMSLERWRRLERRTGRELYTRTGLLSLGNEHDGTTRASYQVLRELGIPIKQLTHSECAGRYPQFSTEAYDFLTYNEEAGVLHASYSLQILKALICELGGTILEQRRVIRIEYDSAQRPLRLYFQTGEELLAGRIVLATGYWVHTLLGELQLPVRLTRQYLLYFTHLAHTIHKAPTFPAFMADDLYGFPPDTSYSSNGSLWLKSASHSFGVPIDPDGTMPIEELVVASVTKKLCALLPALRQASLAHIDTCVYDVSADGDFILDHVPGDERILFATGLSGHGFKFGPLLGELLANMLCGSEQPISMQRFSRLRFAELARAGSVA